MGYIWKFVNVETQNKHEVSLGSCLCKMNLSFFEILAGTIDWVFIMVSFYSDAQAWQVTETFISCLKLRDGPFSFDYMEK